MYLRKLTQDDAPHMLEWMHDPEVVVNMKADFASKTISSCRAFIDESYKDKENIHLAVSDEDGAYMGTVSLKHIHRQESWAEFAIVVCKAAMGRGIARDAMEKILRYGVETEKLKNIYWCVSRENQRAVRFYDKNGYRRITEVSDDLLKLYREEADQMLWYVYPGKLNE